MKQRRSPQRGMAVFEVGVAMVVLSVSFLSVGLTLAGHARNQRSGQAMVRAAALANDLAEQMRANRAAVEASGTDRGFVLDDTYNALTQSDAVAVPTCGGRYMRPPSINEVKPACTNAKGFADYATAVWLSQVQMSLNGGAGSISFASGDSDPRHRRIAVAWMDPVNDRKNNASAPVVDSNCALVAKWSTTAPPAGVRCFVLDFQL